MSAKQVKRILLLLMVVLVSSSIILCNKITSPTPSASAIGVSDEVRLAVPGDTPSISQRTIRPVRLRREISESTIRKIREIIRKFLKGESSIYMHKTFPTSQKYVLALGYEKDCNGGTACRLGMISAEKLTETATEPLETGIRSNFVDATCGANCSDSTISWNLNGSRYTLGIKAGKKEILVKMAHLFRNLAKLQELWTEGEQGSLIAPPAVGSPQTPLKKGGLKSPPFPKGGFGGDRYATNADHTQTVPAVKAFGESQGLIAKGVIWNYREYLLKTSNKMLQNLSSTATQTLIGSQQTYASNPYYCDRENPNSEIRTENSEFTFPKVRRYAVLRLGDGINCDQDEVVEDVKTLQDLLMKEGFIEQSEIDGLFGPTTLNAVKEFQNSRGINDDGIVGEKTWSALWNEPVKVYYPYDNLISSHLDEIIESIPLERRSLAWYSVPLILWECDRSGVTDRGQIAYILATAEHESRLGKWMVEFGSLCEYYEWRSDLGNNQPGDGCRYKGRGFVQITGRKNYTYWSGRLGIDLVNFPEKAEEPEIAAKILVVGMRDGTFTDHKLEDYILRGYWRDFYNARRIVNGLDRAEHIAAIAKAYYRAL